MNRFILVKSMILLALSPLAGRESADMVTEQGLRAGLDHLRAGRLEEASRSFQDVLDNPRIDAFHADALFWIVKTDIVLGRFTKAAEFADLFLSRYPLHEGWVEISYHRARLLHLNGRSEESIVALGLFIEAHPGSAFLPSAHYWIGEALMALGRLEEADAVFVKLLKFYPASVKREAARFRRSEIALMYRERDLLDLLKWSHEEYLREAEDFYRREAELKDTLTSYGEGTEEDFLKERRLFYTERLLQAKSSLLELKAQYLELLLEAADER